MSAFTFDTSFIISKKLSVLPDNFFYSDVVLLELIGSSNDESVFKRHQKTRKAFMEEGRLIIPNADDWLMASKILYWLETGKKKKNRGMSPPKRLGATQRMALDALIAMSARRYDVTVVTENFDDFNAIKYYRDFKLMRGSEFLDKFG